MDMMSGGEKPSKPGFASLIHQKHLSNIALWKALNAESLVSCSNIVLSAALPFKSKVMTGKIWLWRFWILMDFDADYWH